MTAETAIVLPLFVLLLVLALWIVAAAAATLRCGDAARAAARALARGDTASQVQAQALGTAPEGARWTADRVDGVVTVRVSAAVQPFRSWAGFLPAVPVGSTVTAVDET